MKPRSVSLGPLPWTQARRGFAVTSFPVPGDPAAAAVTEAVADNAVSPVPDQVQFRLDFPAWRRTLPASKGALVDLLAVGHRTAEAAAACGVSAARVSQLRREFRAGYRAFCHGDTVR